MPNFIEARASLSAKVSLSVQILPENKSISSIESRGGIGFGT